MPTANGERIVDRAVSPSMDEPARSEVRTMMMHTLLPDALHSDVREIVHQDERDRIRRSHDAHCQWGKDCRSCCFSVGGRAGSK